MNKQREAESGDQPGGSPAGRLKSPLMLCCWGKELVRDAETLTKSPFS